MPHSSSLHKDTTFWRTTTASSGLSRWWKPLSSYRRVLTELCRAVGQSSTSKSKIWATLHSTAASALVASQRNRLASTKAWYPSMATPASPRTLPAKLSLINWTNVGSEAYGVALNQTSPRSLRQQIQRTRNFLRKDKLLQHRSWQRIRVTTATSDKIRAHATTLSSSSREVRYLNKLVVAPAAQMQSSTMAERKKMKKKSRTIMTANKTLRLTESNRWVNLIKLKY